ncbi:hypothetical protein MMC10_009171 [Thelotrema lepadinum]|nr:hypothetical protein [Thelotrema lepadinum]
MASLDKEIQELRGARQQVEQDERQIIEERQKLEKDAEALETEQKRLANKRGVNFLPSKQSAFVWDTAPEWLNALLGIGGTAASTARTAITLGLYSVQ